MLKVPKSCTFSPTPSSNAYKLHGQIFSQQGLGSPAHFFHCYMSHCKDRQCWTENKLKKKGYPGSRFEGRICHSRKAMMPEDGELNTSCPWSGNRKTWQPGLNWLSPVLLGLKHQPMERTICNYREDVFHLNRSNLVVVPRGQPNLRHAKIFVS